MNLLIISENNKSNINKEELKSLDPGIKINGEYLIERIIRIGRNNGIEKVFCLLNSNELELKHHLLTNNFRVPVKVIVQDTESSLHSLFVMAPFLMKEPFFLVTKDLIFSENEFSEFITYSLLQEDTDGVLAVTRYLNEKESLYVAMNDEDIILKFSDSKDGYSWANGSIYYFLPAVFNEMEYAIQGGISNLKKALQLLISKKYILKGFSFSKIIKVENLTDIVKAEDLISTNKYRVK